MPSGVFVLDAMVVIRVRCMRATLGTFLIDRDAGCRVSGVG